MKIKIVLVLAVFFTCSTIPLAQATVFPEFELAGENDKLEDYLDNWAALPIISDEDEEPDSYTVTKGDNLYRIALNHSVPLFSLMEWNELTEDLIHPGDVLIVSGDEPKSDMSQTPTTSVAMVPEAEQPATAPKAVAPASSPSASAGGKELTVTATAYTAYCKGCSGTTAYGIDLRANPNQKVIAVDPRIIPLGTKVWVEGYGEAVAGDTGGAIKGNKIDVFIPSHSSAMEWGVKKVKLRVLN